MKIIHFVQIGFLAIAIMVMPFTADAQQPSADPANIPHLQAAGQPSQYPSLIEISGDAVGGTPNTKFRLRCGYTINGNQMILDPTVNDLLLTNAASHSYTRYQFIDGKPIIGTADTYRAPVAGSIQILLQVTEPDDSLQAKSCSFNLQADAPQTCTPTESFITADQSKAAVAAMAKQCSDFMGQMASQIDASIYNPQKTKEWKAKLDKILAILEQ